MTAIKNKTWYEAAIQNAKDMEDKEELKLLQAEYTGYKAALSQSQELQGNKMFATYKNADDLTAYIERHNGTEKAMLYMGWMLAHNMLCHNFTHAIKV